jgi:hypothetical protein
VYVDRAATSSRTIIGEFISESQSFRKGESMRSTITNTTRDLLVSIAGGAVLALLSALLRILGTASAITLGCGSFTILMLVGWCLERQRELRSMGIKRIYKEFKKSPSALDFITKANKNVDLLAISCYSFLEEDKSSEVILEKIRTGARVRVLVLNPESKYLADKAIDENQDPNKWKRDIETTIGTVKRIGKDVHRLHRNRRGSVEIAKYDTLPLWRVMLIDGSRAYLQYYFRGFKEHDSPVCVVENDKRSLFKTIDEYFNWLWENSEKA